MNSLDPRVNRLPKTRQPGGISPLAPLDQFGTFEVFVQAKAGKPFQHEGSVHAPNPEMAFILAKETFTRRFTCTSLCVVETRKIFTSILAEGDQNVYDLLSEPETVEPNAQCEPYEVYHLIKRGKQPVHAGTVHATSPEHAIWEATKSRTENTALRVWIVRTGDIRFTSPQENDLWQSLPEKKFREAAAYKGGEKLTEFLTRQQP